MHANFLHDVDLVIKRLRSHLLGFDTTLEQLLPCDLKKASNEQQASYLSDRLLFCLAHNESLELKALHRCHAWFYEIIFYLLRHVSPCDHTLDSFLRIFELPILTRDSMITNLKDPSPFPHLLSDLDTPITQKQLERAILQLHPNYCRTHIYHKLTLYFSIRK